MAKIKRINSASMRLNELRKERLVEYGMYSLIGATGLLFVAMAHEFDTGKAQMLVENITNETMARATGATGLGLSGLSLAGFISSRIVNKKRREEIKNLKMELMQYETCVCDETEEDILKR